MAAEIKDNIINTTITIYIVIGCVFAAIIFGMVVIIIIAVSRIVALKRQRAEKTSLDNIT